ncbi:LLM class flavin-dependent oxidoreductase [Roseateles sp. SL47]|uniref:MupA/Atu3671 family FMN-dependent luciferase-like monooxygenase n=1 Tax=Roseateles sp. SL47 TaxID=2995138 RepID=UPI00226F2512|nr:MupA/Atu3671 family FMN-dependent luciferase-like monooxygenase [Roseateles sp. SL47]WAC73070.1 LLM class flavin-dependent oxidoreductase [Roseateles sp. SL47]
MPELKRQLAALTPDQRAKLKARLAGEAAPPKVAPSASESVVPNGRPIDFTLFFFSANGASQSLGKYELLLRCAEFGDTHGFKAIWTPERHFSQFGGLYPNPAVLGAALAARTSQLEIRAGSVVLPLHNPLAVAEDWAVVDNLSGGRVGLAFATGWHKTDFVLRPEAFATRRESMAASIELLQKLWRGEQVSMPGVDGEPTAIVTFPRPTQPALKFWLTCKSEEGWAAAGRMGANVLAMMGASKTALAQCIATYRRARAEVGLPADSGTVSVMLHTYIDNDATRAKAKTREPLQSYLEDYIQQYRTLADPAIQQQVLSHKNDFLDFAFERYFEQASLLGPQSKCQGLLNELGDMGVNEIACLIDFGIDDNDVIASLALLADMANERRRAHAPSPAHHASFPEPA